VHTSIPKTCATNDVATKAAEHSKMAKKCAETAKNHLTNYVATKEAAEYSKTGKANNAKT